MAAKTLNQIVGAEKEMKPKWYGEIQSMHKQLMKSELVNGEIKIYEPKVDGGETFPDQRINVQINFTECFKRARELWTQIFDTEATKDATNMTARADIVLGVEVIAKDVPATTLLYLEKQLKDIHAFVEKTVSLDPAFSWNLDKEAGMHKSAEVLTHKTAKTQKAIVKYDATKEHPAQTEMITVDETVGYWHTTKLSGAIPADRKLRLLDRINAMMVAVKHAREEANTAPIVEKKIGSQVLDFIFED